MKKTLVFSKISYLLGIAVYVILILSFFVTSFLIHKDQTLESQAKSTNSSLTPTK